MQFRYVPRQVASILRVSGRDRIQFLQGMVTNDVSGEFPEAGIRAFHLDNKGAIVYPMTLHTSSDAVYIDIDGARPSDVIASLDHYLVMERCSLKDAVGSSPSCWLFGDLDTAFPSSQHSKDGSLHVILEGDVTVYGLAVFRSTGPCYVVWSPDVDVTRILDDSGASEISLEAADYERISTGIPVGCADFSRILAMESGIVDKAVSFKKGCYIGQEVTARIDARGRTHRELVVLEFDGVTDARDVYSGEMIVGQIRSCTKSTTDRNFAICHLRLEARTDQLTLGGRPVAAVRNVV